MITTVMWTSVFQGKLQIYVLQLCLEITRGLNLTVGLTHIASPKILKYQGIQGAQRRQHSEGKVYYTRIFALLLHVSESPHQKTSCINSAKVQEEAFNF